MDKVKPKKNKPKIKIKRQLGKLPKGWGVNDVDKLAKNLENG